MEERDLFLRIKSNDESAFEQLFRKHYQPLCNYALRYLADMDLAEEIVQQLFCRFWEKRSTIDITSSVSAYLYGAVRNHCLNELRQQKTRRIHHGQIGQQEETTYFTDQVQELELDERIEKAIQKLPEASKKAFLLSRVDGLKYADIAREMGISVKAVEANISRALKKLRMDLKDFLIQLILFFWIN